MSTKRRKLMDIDRITAKESTPPNTQSLSFPTLPPESKTIADCEHSINTFTTGWIQWVDNALNSESQPSPKVLMESECKTNETPNGPTQYVDDLKQQNESLQRQMAALREQFKQTQNNKNDLKQQNETLHRQITTLRAQIEQTQKNKSTQYIDDLKQQNEALQRQIASLRNQRKKPQKSETSTQQISDLKQQIAALQKQHIASLDQLEQIQKSERKHQQLYRAELREKDRYKLRLKALAQMIKTGQKPHFNRVSMNKMDPICTETVHQIKHKIKIVHCALNKTKFTVEIKGYTQHKWMTKKSLAQIVKKHYRHNLKLNPSKPDILINKSHMPYNFVLKCFRIKKDKHRIKALASGYQRGLKSLIDIPKGTVIGQYIGVEYTMDEWQNVFSHSNEEAVRNTYAFDLMINVPLDNNEYKEEQMVIDGYGLREKIMEHERIGNGTTCPYSAHLLYINDCRADIALDYPDDEDLKYWNIDFVEAVINGFPAVFLITRCDVKRGEELMSYYGESYDVALKQQTEYQRMQNCMITLVDNSILHGVDISGDTWTLD